MTKTAELEALFFVTGEEGLTLRELSGLLTITPSAVSQQIEKLSDNYRNNKDSALTIIETAGKYRLATKATFNDLLQHYAKTPMNQSLSKAALEVLAIIAYKQPLTRLEVDKIRGVNSSGTMTTLQAFELIEVVGKKEVIGAPNLYATTAHFLDYIGINNLIELPEINEEALMNIDEVDIFNEKELNHENQ
ncbi:segregation and condensation protein B [Lactococcus hodotermopsidis]|uniref:Segregation and condensation protein B n=1 Tax=Pseudolactococcus hodotermopsidis TaxID=2709157 RepID=A0A6A0BAS2_9LACT|nr:SMC-Scp complex subunit ScpB [Lactococcus hodotermopsidis]GFH41906.1 segregation and condensation protein B [Lactococcus hodotermopsidis]